MLPRQLCLNNKKIAQMKYLFTLLLLFMFTCGFTQRNQQASLDISGSMHGSGDLLGLGVNVEYGKYIMPRLEWTGNLTTTIHSDTEEVLITYSGSGNRDASFRMVTAGIQLGSQLYFAPVRTASNELKIGAGPIVRYQSSNASGGYGLTILPGPEPAFTFYNREKQNIVSAGYQVSFAYAFTFRKGFLLGLKASLQNDTNADIITQVGLRLGKRF